MSLVLSILLCLIAGVALANPKPPNTQASRASVLGLLRDLPLRFEPNQGQAPGGTRFVSRTARLTVSLVDAGLELRTRSAEPVRMTWHNATGGTVFEGVDRLPGQSNYFRGRDPKRWQTGIPQFQKVQQREVYPGIDVVFYGNGRLLEFDFVVSPGADAGRVSITFDGAERVEISDEGDLVVHTPSGEFVSRRPRVYQMQDGVEQAVDAAYVFQDEGRVGFQLAEHDTSLALVIDPVVEYGTYLAGEDDDGARDVVVDANGNAFITGFAEGAEDPPQFPSTPGSFQPNPSGSSSSDSGQQGELDPELDAFVLKMNPEGTALIYGTFLGGGNRDIGLSIAIDDSGAAYVCGDTLSTNFPTTTGALRESRPGFQQTAFVAKLSPDGSTLEYGTYLGGSGVDIAHDLALDPTGAAVVAGQTRSGDFPLTAGVVGPTLLGGIEAFVAHLSADGSSLLYATLLSGSGDDVGYGVALDADGNSYIAGTTASSDFPSTGGAFQPTLAGGTDAFVAKLSPTGAALGYSTFIGGSSDDEAHDIFVRSDGSATIVGSTESADLPLGDSAFDDSYNGGGDVLVATLDPAGATASCTYLGGSGRDEAYAVTVSGGDTIVAGETRSDDFPFTEDADQKFLRGAADAFVSRMTSEGELASSTYYGSTNDDAAHGVAVGPDGGVFMVGVTNYQPPPTGRLRTTIGSFQRSGIDDLDGFAVKFEGVDPNLPLITSEGVVNAAGFAQSVAPDSIATAFVQNAADEDSIEPASPLPTERNGTSLEITDSEGATRATGLFGIFNDGKQINFYVDPATAVGPATITLRREDGASSSAPIEVKLVSPGIFFLANADAQNVALAQYLRISGGVAGPLQLTFNAADFSLTPIDLGPEGDQIYIALFGTGIRLVDGLEKITATIDGAPVPALALAPAAGFFGLDQVNLGPIPRSFIGAGPVEIVLTVDGVVVNTVLVSFL